MAVLSAAPKEEASSRDAAAVPSTPEPPTPVLRLRGGKGGFGALLRAAARDFRGIRDDGSMRDLRGRRLRDARAGADVVAAREAEADAAQAMRDARKAEREQERERAEAAAAAAGADAALDAARTAAAVGERVRGALGRGHAPDAGSVPSGSGRKRPATEGTEGPETGGGGKRRAAAAGRSGAPVASPVAAAARADDAALLGSDASGSDSDGCSSSGSDDDPGSG